MSDIPLAREFIDAMIRDLECGIKYETDELISRLVEIKSRLYRKPPIRKADRQSQPMTPELAASIRAFAKRNQHMTFQDIGQRFNVNAGRVTEALQEEQAA